MLLLVYDYMPNGSLDKHIFGGKDAPVLNWEQLYNVVSGVASALNYLHHEYDQMVVHRDIKPSNIMLDSTFNARLGDFGLARALDSDKSSYTDMVGVPGMLGYIAPEFFHTGGRHGSRTCSPSVPSSLKPSAAAASPAAALPGSASCWSG
ncbi:hypothetical protein HU200_041792 [Digitaria exilis]|uniref:non-specific serine/threonine protein kinase n=1 Tax=Digitaria exilis TaxID=1010633 RepID=A0A835EDE0_9POAL|nr:hypothetical protein HU200_041792 [Digitaria exilis]